MPAVIELKDIVKLMTETDRESFEGLLKEWYNRCGYSGHIVPVDFKNVVL